MPYPTAALPPRPSLSLLSDRAKALRKAHAAGDPDAIERVLRYHPAHEGTYASRAAAADLSTRDAQLVVAREHGFDNWTQLKRYVDSLRHVDGAPTRIGKAVPFFGVADMDASLGHYVDRLGFRVARSWETSPPERRGQGVSIFHMCHDAVAYYREVTARGGSMAEPRVGNRLWETEIRDPDSWNLAYESPTDVDEETRLSDVDAEGAAS